MRCLPLTPHTSRFARVNTHDAGKLLWDSSREGVHDPSELRGRLTMDEAVRVQLDVLGRSLAAGERQTGWKIGLTNDAVRAQLKSEAPVHGYLLASRGFAGGQSIDIGSAFKPTIESELCFLLGGDLRGPGVTTADVLDALDAVCPAFELLEGRGDMAADLPLSTADNVRQWGYVLGQWVRPYPTSLDLADVRAEVRQNGNVVVDVLGRDAIDDQVRAVAWLANSLARFDRFLESGQIIMSGSYHGARPIAMGERWETQFSGIGSVTSDFG
jgi:2-keto-4-pentenoate hydratase